MTDADDTADSKAVGGAMSDDDLLKEAREFLAARITVESKSREEALNDLKFLTGDQWPPEVERARKADNRPCITVNKLPTFLHQVTNDQRQNKSSIKVHAVDDDADPETADVVQGLIRHIEYDSNADVAYDRAVNSAAAIGFGYWRLVTEYCSPDSFDQDIKFKSVRNPFTVYLGAHVEPDASDMLKAMITEELPLEEFKRQYPDADTGSSIDKGIGDNLKDWLQPDKMRIAEFYKVQFKATKLYRTMDGRNVFESDLTEADKLLLQMGADGKPKTRMTDKREVWWYKLTGVQVLERCQVMCDWIPIFEVTGDEWDVEGEIVRQGLIRNAKGPAQMYNVWMTSATEEIGLRPKTPYIGAVGQFAADKKWQSANTRSYTFMEYDPVTVDGVMAPPPQRQPMADVPAGVLTMAQHASDDIKATTGIFNASLGQQGNETSGVAITGRQREGDVGSFHYIDNLRRNQRQCGRCILSMLPHYYDQERVVRIMGEDESVEHVPINQPIPEQDQKPDKDGAIKTVLNDITVGKYDVVVSSGPSYSTQREEAADALIQLGQNVPKLWDIAGDIVVKNFDWHGADEVAERWKRTIPAAIIGPTPGSPEEDLPPEVQQHMAQQDQLIQHLQQELQAAQKGIPVAQIRAQSAETIAQHQAQVKSDLEMEKLHVKAALDMQTNDAKAQREAENNRVDLAQDAQVQHAKDLRAAAAIEAKTQREQEMAHMQAMVQSSIADANNETKKEIAALAGSVQMWIASMQPPPAVVSEATKGD